jgi:hypothetical protein
MLVKIMAELLGSEVLAQDGRYGVLDDVYFDRDAWQLCYLVVSTSAARMLVPAGCVAAMVPARHRLTLGSTRAQLAAHPGTWSMAAAAEWLPEIRVCRARDIAGWPVVGDDGPAGEMVDLLLDPASGSLEYALALLADGFGARHIALPLAWADALEPRDGIVRMRRPCALLCSASAVI